jgi:hypothetical protein
MQSDPEYGKEVRMDPAEFNPKKKRSGGVHSETEAFEGWVDSIGEATIKPYVSMYRGDDGKMIYDVLDKDSNSAFKSGDYDAAREYLSKNYDKLREYAKMGKFPRDPEIAKKDKENATKLAVTQMDKEMDTPAYKRMQSGDPRYVDKTKKEEMTDKEVDKFHTELDKVVHKHIGHSSDEKKEKEDMKKEEVFPEGTTFEDIKPYVSMYRDERGKVVNDVLDSDGKSVFKTHDGKKAMAYLARNFDKLKRPMQKESINEAKIDSDTAQNIAGVEEEISRITQLANYQ